MELKPCPFCGGEAAIWYRGTKHGRIAFVACEVCGAQTKAFSYHSDLEEVDLNDLGAQRAINAWNRRSSDE